MQGLDEMQPISVRLKSLPYSTCHPAVACAKCRFADLLWSVVGRQILTRIYKFPGAWKFEVEVYI